MVCSPGRFGTILQGFLLLPGKKYCLDRSFFDYTTALWEKLQYAVPRFIGRADDSGQLWVSLLDSRNFDARLIALTARLEQLMKKK